MKILNGETPLLSVCKCRSGNEAVVKYLVEQGANINKENVLGDTSLYWACKIEEEAIVRHLIEHEVDINKETTKYKSLLIDVYYKGNEAIVKYLVEQPI